jgi:hypothetical protein
VNPAIKQKWIDALRSGAYSQGRGRLAGSVVGNPEDGPPSFCCLGVLCDLAVKENVIPEPVVAHRTPVWDGEAPVSGYFLKFADEGGYLPSEVVEWAGLNTAYNPLIGHGDDQLSYRQAAAWNDDGIPFAEIADMIEDSL